MIVNNQWRLDPLSISLPPDIAIKILATPIPSVGEDRLFCPFAKGRFFDSKSLYSKLWLQKREDRSNKKWIEIWSSDLPPKLKIFLWQLSWNSIPTNHTLALRGMDVQPHCIFCGTQDETWIHILRDCHIAQECWQLLHVDQEFFHMGKEEWLQKNVANTNNWNAIPWNLLYGFVIWKLWIRRNKWVFEKITDTSPKMIKDSMWLAAEVLYSKAQSQTGPTSNQDQIITKGYNFRKLMLLSVTMI